ncbi:MAG: lipopolysaccharide heptosyltransferase I [Gallionella sp.]|nr:lipopolysaccharide heptosyltransferase I [Gallionella sp.]
MKQSISNNQPLRILLVKTSSLGDVLHNLPVVSDIVKNYPNAQIDWLVEEGYAALPKLHPKVNAIIPVSLRSWRGKLLSTSTWHEFKKFRMVLSAGHYDFVIDTQGLLKSALLMLGSHGLRCGFDWSSAREPLASLLYQQTYLVELGQHAVERNRLLVSQSLGYNLKGRADFAIHTPNLIRPDWLGNESYAVLLHSTSRANKLWDESNWIALGKYLQQNNIRSILPWGSEAEKLRSIRLASAIPNAITPPRLSLNEAAYLLGKTYVVVGVDTGLTHLSAALSVPTVGIYTSTNPKLTGLYEGPRVINLGGISLVPGITAVIDAIHQVRIQ